MAPETTPRTAATRAALLEGALHEFSAFGYRRSSMESVARRAGVSRATLYLHWSGKEELFRALVEQLHEEHVAEMEAVLDAGDLAFEDRLIAILEARFLRFVELTATGPAKAYGLHPRKGTIAVGSDADLVVWEERDFVLENRHLHHAVDYTPYEGQTLRAWPALTLSRGDVVWDGTNFHPRRGRGRFLPCAAPSLLPSRQGAIR